MEKIKIKLRESDDNFIDVTFNQKKHVFEANYKDKIYEAVSIPTLKKKIKNS